MHSKEELNRIIHLCDSAFDVPVHTRKIYQELLNKLCVCGKVLVAFKAEVLGYVAFYCNNRTEKSAYISLVAVEPGYQNRHIGQVLLQNCEDVCRAYDMKYIGLEVKKNNSRAIRFYNHNGFNIIADRDESYIMQKNL